MQKKSLLRIELKSIIQLSFLIFLFFSFFYSFASSERKSVFSAIAPNSPTVTPPASNPPKVELKSLNPNEIDNQGRKTPAKQITPNPKDKTIKTTKNTERQKPTPTKKAENSKPFMDGYVDVDPMVLNCSPTPILKPAIDEPKKFRSSNDLTREVGDFKSLDGEKIVIIGRVMDKNCIPISELPIKIWQIDSNDNSAKQMNGTATSDNMGRFQFVTLFKNSHKMPYLGLKVKTENNSNYYSIFFHGDNNSLLSKFSNNDKINVIMPYKEINNKKYYFLDLVLNEAQQFKTF